MGRSLRIITPQRLDNSYRIYRQEEVALLKKALQALDAFAKTMPHVKFFIGGTGVKNIVQQFELEAIQEAHSLHEVFSKIEKV